MLRDDLPNSEWGPTSHPLEVPGEELARALGHTPSCKVRVKAPHCHLRPSPRGPLGLWKPSSLPSLQEQFQAAV